jgi:hypothetical protein
VVEEDAIDAGRIGVRFHTTHAEVALHRVTGFQRDVQIVERRRIGRPQFRLAERQLHLGVGLSSDAAHYLAVQLRRRREIHNFRRRYRQSQQMRIDVRRHGDLPNVRYRHRLQPDRLPDP